MATKIADGAAAAAAMEGDGTAQRLMEHDRLWKAALDELVGYLAGKPKLTKAMEEHGEYRPAKPPNDQDAAPPGLGCHPAGQAAGIRVVFSSHVQLLITRMLQWKTQVLSS